MASLLMRPELVQVARAPETKETAATQEATKPADAEGAAPSEPPAETQPSGPAP